MCSERGFLRRPWPEPASSAGSAGGRGSLRPFVFNLVPVVCLPFRLCKQRGGSGCVGSWGFPGRERGPDAASYVVWEDC